MVESDCGLIWATTSKCAKESWRKSQISVKRVCATTGIQTGYLQSASQNVCHMPKTPSLITHVYGQKHIIAYRHVGYPLWYTNDNVEIKIVTNIIVMFYCNTTYCSATCLDFKKKHHKEMQNIYTTIIPHNRLKCLIQDIPLCIHWQVIYQIIRQTQLKYMCIER